MASEEDTKEGVCYYHLCDKKGKLYRCKYCGEYFCKEHLRPKPPGTPKFDSTDPHDLLFMEEWHRPGGHPCMPYLKVWEEEYKKEKNKYGQALDSFLNSSNKKVEVDDDFSEDEEDDEDVEYDDKYDVFLNLGKLETLKNKIYNKLWYWFHNNRYELNNLKRDIIWFSLSLIFLVFIYEHVILLNHITIGFLKFGSVLLVILVGILLNSVISFFSNLKDLFLKLDNKSKKILMAIMILFLIFFNKFCFFCLKSIIYILNNIDYSYFNPFIFSHYVANDEIYESVDNCQYNLTGGAS